MRSSLHLGADAADFDASAFLYAALRLPDCMECVRRVVMGQSEEVFMRGGLRDVSQWQRVDAAARRRRVQYDGAETLAAFVSSVSDIDDLIPSLTAYQIEWNKLHRRLVNTQLGHDLAAGRAQASAAPEQLREILCVSVEDMSRLYRLWGTRWDQRIRAIAAGPLDIHITSLAKGFNDYRRAVESWWDDLLRAADALYLEFRPIYLFSSNLHSLPNLLSGHALAQRDALVEFVIQENPEGLAEEWQRLSAAGAAEEEKVTPRRQDAATARRTQRPFAAPSTGSGHALREVNGAILGMEDAGRGLSDAQANLLYYVQRLYLKDDATRRRAMAEIETAAGVHRFDEPHALDISAQIIDLQALDPAQMDPRVRTSGLAKLRQSRALIVNVDYPLGFAAYHLLAQVASSCAELLGVYIMGKAATLSGRVGDVMIPNVVYDEHSRNTFLFKNCFLAQHVAPYLLHGTVFDNQKAVTVRGTFLQNREFMSVFYREGYTDLEMEAGPYLSAIYEDIYPQRYPVNEIVNLFINAPYDIGLLHYASDTPYSRRQSLLSKSLSYFGVDATYACSTAILRRILAVEAARLAG